MKMTDPLTRQPNYPQFLEELAAKIAAFLVDRGLAAALAQAIGQDCAEYVRADWGGQQIYIPRGSAFDLSSRDLEVEAMWNGPNMHEVCLRYGITSTQVRRIAKRVRKNRRNGGSDDGSGSR